MTPEIARVRIPDLARKKKFGQKIAMLTAYDASMAQLLDTAGVDVLLVGDSLGNVIMGCETTLTVTMDIMIHHTRAVANGVRRALVVADMPFLTYQATAGEALRNAGRLLGEGGAAAVKLEGGLTVADTVRRIVDAGIPVMGHVGLTPQSVHQLGGYRTVGSTSEEAERLFAGAAALDDAGAFAIVLECLPADIAGAITASVKAPTIGIGSGVQCDGQVLVSYDAFGLHGGRVPRFVKRYARLGEEMVAAARQYVADVEQGKFPDPGKWDPLIRRSRRRMSEASRMETVAAVAEMRRRIARERGAGRTVSLVPTMGALHAGHGALLDCARRGEDYVVVSIFVNPIQFDRREDYEAYAIDLPKDLEFCAAHGADLVFAPTPRDMYPEPQRAFVDVAGLGDYLCGQFRPGHFRGVATVVAKLFGIVQPDRAFFGEKDAQQLAIIRKMTTDLNMPVEIVPVATVREPDGLALSSRNRRLTAEERSIAPALYRALVLARERLAGGSVSQARDAAFRALAAYPLIRVEYLEVVDAAAMSPVERVAGPVRIAMAAWLGATRLIDNVPFPG